MVARPKELRDVIELARLHSPKAIKTLAEIMNSDRAPPAARVAAANAILDRGYGKPAQTLDASVRSAEFSIADKIVETWKKKASGEDRFTDARVRDGVRLNWRRLRRAAR